MNDRQIRHHDQNEALIICQINEYKRLIKLRLENFRLAICHVIVPETKRV